MGNSIEGINKMEYEVYKSAVITYKNKYNIYSDWEIDGSDTTGRPYRVSMPGYYLRLNEYPECMIVGDVLTSNKIWGDVKKRNNKELCSLLKKYESMYHMDGNYIPIPEIKNYSSANLRGNNCDTFTHHLNICRYAIKGTLNTYPAWQKWAKCIWIPYCMEKEKKETEYWKFFIEEFYFIDFVDSDFAPLSFVVGREKSNPVGIVDNKDDDAKVIETLNNTMELIIKRNYRMEKGKKENIDWTKENDYEKYREKYL